MRWLQRSDDAFPLRLLNLHLWRLRDCAADEGVVDGVKAYFGSANLTGAGMGAKSKRKCNFENGVLTDDPALVAQLVEQFGSVWRGRRLTPLGFLLARMLISDVYETEHNRTIETKGEL